MEIFLMSIIVGLVILTGIMVIWAVIDIFQQTYNTTEKLLWLIVIILAPILGSIIYFLFGRKRRRRRYY